MATKITFDFYKLIPEGRAGVHYSIIRRNVLRKVNVPFHRYGTPVRLETANDGGNHVFGTASATSLVNLPVVIEPARPGMRDLQLNKDEGLASLTGFLVCALGNDVFVILHSNGRGLRANGFMYLLSKLCGVDDWELSYLINAAKIARAMGFRTLRKFDAKISQPGDPQRYATRAVQSTAAAAVDVMAKDVRFILSAGRERRASLDRDRVRAAIDDLLRFKDQEVISLKITGREFDDAYFGPNRTPNPDQTEHPIRSKPYTRFGPNRTAFRWKPNTS